jgi:hypothetical protein
VLEQRGDSIGHVGDAGDVNGGKAWRTVRRPSDMVGCVCLGVVSFFVQVFCVIERVLEADQGDKSARETWEGAWKGLCKRWVPMTTKVGKCLGKLDSDELMTQSSLRKASFFLCPNRRRP